MIDMKRSKLMCTGEFCFLEFVFWLWKNRHVSASQFFFVFLQTRKQLCQEETNTNRAKTVPQSPVVCVPHLLCIWNIYILVKPQHGGVFFCVCLFFSNVLFMSLNHPHPSPVPTLTHTQTFVLFWWKAVSASEYVTRRCFVLLRSAGDLILVKADVSWCWKMDRYFVVNCSVWFARGGFEELAPQWGGGRGKKRDFFVCCKERISQFRD